VRTRRSQGGPYGAHFISPGQDAAAVVLTTTVTGMWRGNGDLCCLKAAGQRDFLVTSGIPYFDTGSEPAGDTPFF
jgi:hypothetical protein